MMAHFWTGFKSLSLKQIMAVAITSGSLIAVGIVTAIILTNRNNSDEIASEVTTRQEELTETETISFQTIERDDDSKNEGTTETQQEGKNGEKTIKYLVTYDGDNNEISREKISEEITTEPVDKIIAKGTKKTTPVVTQKPTTSNNTSNNSAQTEDLCKTKLAGWDIPASQCPGQTRALFTELGGWEKVVEAHYKTHQNMEPMRRCNYDGTVCEYDWSGTTAALCFGSVSIDMKTLTVLSVKWDNQPTSTCDHVRNEYPPLPSTEYLTQYLRSLAQ